METVLGILPGLHSNKCVGIDIVALGSPEGLFTPGAWETFVAINLRVLPTEASVPRPHYVILVHQTLHYTGLLPTSSHAADGCIGGF